MTSEYDETKLSQSLWDAGKPTASRLPSGEMDWPIFLAEMMDGKFAYDVYRIGSSSSFVKNQLGASKDYDKQSEFLQNAFTDVLGGKSFAVDDALAHVSQYDHILEWLSDGLVNNTAIGLNKIASLIVGLSHADNQQRQDAQYTKVLQDASRAMLRMLSAEAEKPATPTVLTAENEKDLETVWENWIAETDDFRAIYAFSGLNHLQKWSQKPEEERGDILQKFSQNNKIISHLVILVRYANVGVRGDYSYMAKDLCRFIPETADFLSKNAQEWCDMPEPDYPQARKPSSLRAQ